MRHARLVLAIALASCAAREVNDPRRAPNPLAAEPASPRSIELFPDGASWELKGSSKLKADEIETRVGCTAACMIESTEVHHAGTARLIVEYSAEECERGARVMWQTHSREAERKKWRHTTLASLAKVMDRCPIDFGAGDEVRVTIFMNGGLGCFGKIHVRRVALEPSQASWGADRCLLLYRGLEAAGPLQQEALILDDLP